MTPTPLNAYTIPWSAVFWFCLAAWLSGALFGIGVAERLKHISLRRVVRLITGSKNKRSYYFSEDQGPFSQRKWRRRLGGASAAAVVLIAVVAIAITVANFGSRHHGPKIAGVVYSH